MKIPRSIRQNFDSGVIAPQAGPNLGAISSGASSLASGIQDVSNVLAFQRQQEDVAKAVEYDSELQVQFSDKYREAINKPDVLDNPENLRGEIRKIHDDIIGSEQFSGQSAGVKQIIKSKLAGYREKYMSKGLEFESDQRARNTIKSIDKTLSMLELHALESDDNLDELIDTYTVGTTTVAATGFISEEEAEQHLKIGAQSIIMNRAQRLLNQGDMEGVKALIEDEDYQSILGAEGVQKIRSRLTAKVSLRQDQIDKMESLRTSKPWEYVSKVDSEKPPAISFDNVENLSDTLGERLQYVKIKNKQHGTDMSILRPVEVEQIVSSLDKMKPNAATAIIAGWAVGMTPEQSDMVAAQIYKTRPDIGSAISMAEHDTRYARKILNGAMVRREKLVKLPSDSEVSLKVNDVLGDSVRLPSHRKAIQEVVLNGYADGVFSKEIDESTDVHSDSVKDLIERAVGPVISDNSYTTLGFRRDNGQFVEADDFEDAFEGINHRSLGKEMLVKTHGSTFYGQNGKELDIEDVIDDASLTMIGDGQYRLTMFGGFVAKKDGTPFTLNMKKVLKAYENRPKLPRRSGRRKRK